MIVDASVALKWVVQEVDSDAAVALFGAETLIVPDLLFSEIANGIWKKWRRGELAAVPTLLGTLAGLLQIEPTAPLAVRAAEIAIELSHPAYDCFYIALAEALDDRVMTADLQLIRICAGTPYAIRLLAFP